MLNAFVHSFHGPNHGASWTDFVVKSPYLNTIRRLEDDVEL